MTRMTSETLSAAGRAASPTAASAAFGKGFVLDAWYFVALSRDVAPAALKRHELLGEPVLVGRTRAGTVYAMRDICPHRAAPLSAGRLVERPGEGETIECCYHGWRFRPDGVCAAIPSLVEDQAHEADRIRVRSYPVRESQGMVFVWIASDPRASPEPDHEPPVFRGVVGSEPRMVERMDSDVHIDHAVVGLMDPAHGPFAAEITFRLPGYRWEHIAVGEKRVLALTCLTPLSETQTRITRIFWSDHWAFSIARPFLRLGVIAVLKRDGAMADLQDEGLRYDPAPTLVDDADEQAAWYQQLKCEWSQSRAEGRPFANPVKAATLRRKS